MKQFTKVVLNPKQTMYKEMRLFVKSLIEERGKFTYYHDTLYKNWYFDNPEIAFTFKMKFAGL